MIKLLIVDDSALMRRLLGEIFKTQDDFEVDFARNGEEALDRLKVFQPDVVTLDINMPLMDGLACLDRLMVVRPCPVVMVSSLTEAGADTTLQALQLGAVDFIAKPRGAISLSVDSLTPLLIEKVRAAAKARIRSSLRLAERIKINANKHTSADLIRRRNSVAKSHLKPQIVAHVSSPADTVVLIGASTGGPPALEVLLTALPADFPWPILIAQHMPASFTGPMARRLDRICALTVQEVTGPMPLAQGHVYIGKGDADIIVGMRPSGATVMAAPSSQEHRWHPSVDRMVATALKHLGAERLIGVLLTGMGNDGAAAMTQLRTEGGRTIAEAEETAVVWGMPGELVNAGGAQIVAPVYEIAGCLLDWAQ